MLYRSLPPALRAGLALGPFRALSGAAAAAIDTMPTSYSSDYDMTAAITDLGTPAAFFPTARAMERRIVAHLGPTNSGKTHAALQELRAAGSGIYCGPLRLLAWQVRGAGTLGTRSGPASAAGGVPIQRPGNSRTPAAWLGHLLPWLCTRTSLSSSPSCPPLSSVRAHARSAAHRRPLPLPTPVYMGLYPTLATRRCTYQLSRSGLLLNHELKQIVVA